MMDNKTFTTTKQITALPMSNQTVANWLSGLQTDYSWLLAHSYGGVVWGVFAANEWQLSDQFHPPALPFNGATVTQLRVFGQRGELFVWRDERGLHGSELREVAERGDETAVKHEFVDETQILWGTAILKQNDHFTLLTDGQQELNHAFPMKLKTVANHRPARLRLRHYLVRDSKSGLARISHSRLIACQEELPDGTPA